MIDVKVLQAAGLTEDQVNAVLRAETARKLKLDADRARRYRASRKSRDYRDASRMSRDDNEISKQNQSNGNGRHVTQENGTLYMFSSLERKNIESEKSSRDLRDGTWEKFWSVWPKKEGKFAAQKELPKALKVATIEEIIAGVARAKVSKRWREGYVPYPSKWLKERRWLDDVHERSTWKEEGII